MLVLVVVVVVLAFLDMKKRLVKRRATRVVPRHAVVGMDGALLCHVSMTTRTGSRSMVVPFVDMLKDARFVGKVRWRDVGRGAVEWV